MSFEENIIKTATDKKVGFSVQKAITELSQIKPANLKSSRTSIKEAVRLCKEVFTVLSKCVASNFTHHQVHELVEPLKSLGCTTYQNAAEKFAQHPGGMIGRLIKQKNNIEFPLSAFSMLMSSDTESLKYGWGCMSKGGNGNCWIDEWLYTQEKAADKNL